MSLLDRLKEFLMESRRVLKVTRKPSSFEFKTIVKVAGLGIIIIGIVGFIVQIFRQGLMFR